MTDFLLAITSFVGALVYATIAVAVFKCGSERASTPYSIATCIFSAWFVAGRMTALVAITTGLSNTQGSLAVIPGFLLGVLAIVATVRSATGTDAVILGVFWPVAGVVWLVLRLGVPAVVGIVRFGSRGPLALGTWLAELPGRRERARVARDAEIEARHQRIAELEEELFVSEESRVRRMIQAGVITSREAREELL